MIQPLLIDPAHRRYRALVGTGGIGSGSFFALNGNHTLGREESRSGRFLDRRDYCKLHIVAHYVRTLLGPEFLTLPIGLVGDDDVGRRLLMEMAETGLDLRYVQTAPGAQTLYSVCFIYPDGTGGNLTVDDSACARVSSEFVRQSEGEMARCTGEGIALAMPEVPLTARVELLRLAGQYGLLRAASFTSEEMAEARESTLLTHVDLLAVNLDEAAALAGISAEQAPETVVEAALPLLREVQPRINVSITAGVRGSWTWDGSMLVHAPAHRVPVAGTAGAGDAFFGGLLVGLSAGLSLAQAQELATLVAALSVTSPHTINPDVDRESLRRLAESLRLTPSPEVGRLLGLPAKSE